MRFLYNDPYALRTAMEQLANQTSATGDEREQPIPVDAALEGGHLRLANDHSS